MILLGASNNHVMYYALQWSHTFLFPFIKERLERGFDTSNLFDLSIICAMRHRGGGSACVGSGTGSSHIPNLLIWNARLQ